MRFIRGNYFHQINDGDGDGDETCGDAAVMGTYEGRSIRNENKCIRRISFAVYISVKSKFSTNTCLLRM